MDAPLLDLTHAPHARRAALLLDAFDRLAPGGWLEVMAAEGERPLLETLQARRPEAFDWSTLCEAEPRRVRLQKRRRPGPRGIAEFLNWDHARLDVLLAQAEAAVKTGDFQAAAPYAAGFCCGLARHLSMEEEVLFPAFEAAAGRLGATAAMRSEHVSIRALLEDLEEAVAGGDAARFRTAVQACKTIVASHNVKEERLVYLISDQLAGRVSAAGLVQRMQSRG